MPLHQRMQFLTQLPDFVRRIILGPQLEKVDPAGEERFGYFPGALELDITEIENPVEAAPAQVLGGQANDFIRGAAPASA
jgi:hypothetical protein